MVDFIYLETKTAQKFHICLFISTFWVKYEVQHKDGIKDLLAYKRLFKKIDFACTYP